MVEQKKRAKLNAADASVREAYIDVKVSPGCTAFSSRVDYMARRWPAIYRYACSLLPV